MALEQPSRLALGCYPLGGGYGTVDDDDARRTVDAALDAGWTFLDTAEAYLDSEERLGRASPAGATGCSWPRRRSRASRTATRTSLVALDNSLRRLRTDHLDLYQLHGPQDWVVEFPDAAPIEEIGAALARLVESGKVRHVGVCNLPLATIEALRQHVRAVLHPEPVLAVRPRRQRPDPPAGERRDPAVGPRPRGALPRLQPAGPRPAGAGSRPGADVHRRTTSVTSCPASSPTCTHTGRGSRTAWRPGPPTTGARCRSSPSRGRSPTSARDVDADRRQDRGAGRGARRRRRVGPDAARPRRARRPSAPHCRPRRPPRSSIVWDHFPPEAVRACRRCVTAAIGPDPHASRPASSSLAARHEDVPEPSTNARCSSAASSAHRTWPRASTTGCPSTSTTASTTPPSRASPSYRWRATSTRPRDCRGCSTGTATASSSTSSSHSRRLLDWLDSPIIREAIEDGRRP